MATKTLPATSKDVRHWFVKNPSLVPEGAEKSVQTDCKGRISVKAIEIFNSHAKQHGMKYTEGNEPVVAVSYKARNHRVVTAHVPRTEARILAGKPGSKGPLSKGDLDTVAKALASR